MYPVTSDSGAIRLFFIAFFVLRIDIGLGSFFYVLTLDTDISQKC